MKRCLAVIAMAVLTLTAPALSGFAADETLFDESDVWAMYTKLDAQYAKFGDDHGLMGGVEIGGLLNEKFSVGLALHSLLHEVEPGYNGYDNPSEFDIWYGGLALGYTFYAHKLVHASVSALVAGGQMRLNRTSDGKDHDVQLFVFEPDLNLMVNVTQNSEVGIGVGYRHADTYNSGLEGLGSGDLGGLVASVFLRLTEY